MGCGSSSANDVIKSVDFPEKNPDNLYPNPNQQLASIPPAQKVMAPPMQMQGKPPMQPNKINNNNKTDQHEELQESKSNQIIVSEEHLEEYIQLEKEIHAMEKMKVLQQLHCHVDALQVLIAEITKLEEQKARLEAEIKTKNLGGKPEAKELIKEIDSIEKENPKEKSKKMASQAAPNSLEQQKETITKELEEKRKKHAQLESEVTSLNNSAAELLDKYLKQDELLVCIFGQGYATEEECKLGNQLEKLEEKKCRIENARKKWKEAQLLLEYSCKQLAVAVKQWQNLPHVPTINLEVRYSLPEGAQNNLQLSGQNLQNMANFGDMPHCTPQELAALEAMASSSAPGTVDERHLMVLDNYSDEHKKALARLKWFNKMLNTTIHRDLVDVCEEVRLTSQALRKERIRAVREKYKEKNGKSFDQDIDGMDDDNLKVMLSGCKGDRACPIDSSKLPKMASSEIKVAAPPIGAKPAQIKQINGILPLKELKEIGEKKEIHKFHEGLEINRARVEKHLGEQLNSRRDLRAQRSPNRNEKAS